MESILYNKEQKSFSIQKDYAVLAIYERTNKVKYDLTFEEAKSYQSKLIQAAMRGSINRDEGRLKSIKIAKNEVIENDMRKLMFSGFR